MEVVSAQEETRPCAANEPTAVAEQGCFRKRRKLDEDGKAEGNNNDTIDSEPAISSFSSSCSSSCSSSSSSSSLRYVPRGKRKRAEETEEAHQNAADAGFSHSMTMARRRYLHNKHRQPHPDPSGPFPMQPQQQQRRPQNTGSDASASSSYSLEPAGQEGTSSFAGIRLRTQEGLTAEHVATALEGRQVVPLSSLSSFVRRRQHENEHCRWATFGLLCLPHPHQQSNGNGNDNDNDNVGATLRHATRPKQRNATKQETNNTNNNHNKENETQKEKGKKTKKKEKESRLKYKVWQVTDLAGTVMSVFLVGSAAECELAETFKEGALVLLLNPIVLRTKLGNGMACCLKRVTAQQCLPLGTVLEWGRCRGDPSSNQELTANKSDCPVIIDKRKGQYCKYHMGVTYNKVRSSRMEFNNGFGGKSQEHLPQGPSLRNLSQGCSTFFLDGWLLSTSASASSSSSSLGEREDGASSSSSSSSSLSRRLRRKGSSNNEALLGDRFRELLDQDSAGARNLRVLFFGEEPEEEQAEKKQKTLMMGPPLLHHHLEKEKKAERKEEKEKEKEKPEVESECVIIDRNFVPKLRPDDGEEDGMIQLIF